MSARPEMLRPAVAEVLRLAVPRRGRIMVGVAGPPAAGKSTLAAALADALVRRHSTSAVVVPMDGFHLANAELDRLGLAHRKGAPETFDAGGFVHLLRRLRAADEDLVYAPMYSRTLHEAIAGAIPVPASLRVIVVEGNYLLYDQAPWRAVRPLLDLALFLDAPERSRHGSLMRRQLAKGLDEPAARDWVLSSDEVNARLIADTRHRADVILRRRG
jgi:pantothenate kinase